MLTNNVLCLHIDKSGRLWVGTEGGGIYLYNRQNDRFEEKNQEYNIPGDMVGSIEEDKNGNLWLGTNVGLVKLGAQMKSNEPVVRVYTEADGYKEISLSLNLLAVGRENCFLVVIKAIIALFLRIWKIFKEMFSLQLRI